LLNAYKIRGSVRNGLAVVSIERGASAGSFFTIPPQTQVEIASRKKIITDEHSGRILVDSSAEEEKKMEQLFSKYNILKSRYIGLFYDEKTILYFHKVSGLYINLLATCIPSNLTAIRFFSNLEMEN
jgi:hypothetical protein